LTRGGLHNKGGGHWMALEIVVVAARLPNKLIISQAKLDNSA